MIVKDSYRQTHASGAQQHPAPPCCSASVSPPPPPHWPLPCARPLPPSCWESGQGYMPPCPSGGAGRGLSSMIGWGRCGGLWPAGGGRSLCGQVGTHASGGGRSWILMKTGRCGLRGGGRGSMWSGASC